MNIILVANDNSKDGNYKQLKPEVLTTISNILFLKQLYPEYKIIMYVDDTTQKYYNELGVLSLVDEVNTSVLNRNYNIDKKTFWAYSKIFALRATSAPCVIFDLDFRIFEDIRSLGFFKYDLGAYSLENIENKYYYSQPEECLKGLQVTKDFSWDEFAVNVSCLYFKKSEFKNTYCDWVINFIYGWSFHHKDDNFDYGDNLILFAEQYMLNQFIKKYGQITTLLIDDMQEKKLPKNYMSIGLNEKNYFKYLFHLGRFKRVLLEEPEKYKLEVDTIVHFANEKIKDKRGLEILNNVNSNKDYERCFR